jgi:hypothetical protein
MAQTASDIISDDDVRSIVEKIRNKKYQNRRAFRDYDATNNDSNSVDFPVSDSDFDGDVAEVPPGSEYPRATKDYSTVSAAHTKYGFEIAIPDEDVEDNVIDLVMDHEEDMVRAEETRMDALAYNILSNNTGTSAGTGTTGTWEYGDFTAAYQTAFQNELDMGELEVYVGAQAVDSILNIDEFTPASELGDQVIEQGVLPGGNMVGQQAFLGTVVNMPVYVSNTGDYGSHEGYLVDTSNYGWESTRRGLDVTQYREEDKEQDVWQIDTRVDFVATQTSAAIEIDA